jgi:hypothetical protein
MWCKDMPNQRSRQQAQRELLQLATRRAKRRLDPLPPESLSQAHRLLKGQSSRRLGFIPAHWGRGVNYRGWLGPPQGLSSRNPGAPQTTLVRGCPGLAPSVATLRGSQQLAHCTALHGLGTCSSRVRPGTRSHELSARSLPEVGADLGCAQRWEPTPVAADLGLRRGGSACTYEFGRHMRADRNGLALGQGAEVPDQVTRGRLGVL